MPKQEQEFEPTNITMKDVLLLLQELQKSNRADLLEAIKEMKKPSEAEQAKLDKENALLERRRELRRAEMISEEKARIGKQRSCMHKKKHPRSGAWISAWGGQVNADGYWHPICTVCMKEGPEVKAPIEWIQGGVNATDPDNVYMANLTEAILKEWQTRLGGPKPKAKPLGYTEQEKKELAAV